FGVDDGRPPARVPLVAPRHDTVAVVCEEFLVGLIPVRPFPASGFEEDRSKRLLSFVEGAQANAPVRFPLFPGMDDAVGLVEAFRRATTDVRRGFLVLVEAGDVRAGGIDLRNA